MQLYEDGHGEVCYESRKCPACDLNIKLGDAEGEIEQLKTKVNELEEQLP